MDYETSYANIKSVVEKYRQSESEELNEATTRLRFIDHLLFDCLA